MRTVLKNDHYINDQVYFIDNLDNVCIGRVYVISEYLIGVGSNTNNTLLYSIVRFKDNINCSINAHLVFKTRDQAYNYIIEKKQDELESLKDKKRKRKRKENE